MRAAVWAANLLGWPLIHLLTARIVLQLPLGKFAHDAFIYRERSWERGGRFYRTWLGIHRWKRWLPDGAPWFGGFSKKRFTHRDREYIFTFLLETRRAECAHWCMIACLPLFFLWNPVWACGIMTAYAFAANVPCILAQRYNRAVLRRLLIKVEHSNAESLEREQAV